MRYVPVVTAFALAALAPAALWAQGPPLVVTLDSGTVARLTWSANRRQQVMLVRRLASTSDSVRYCTYPSSGCGPGSVNPVQARPMTALAGIEVRRGNHVKRGALWGAAVGVFLTAYGLAWMAADETHPSTGKKLGIVGIMLGGSIGTGALLGSGGHDWAPPGGR